MKDVPDLGNRIPENCLFNKGITGCGATTLAIENELSTLIAMPYVALVKNKEQQHPDLLGVYQGVSDEEIIRYVRTHDTLKIATTYNSLPRVISVLKQASIDPCRELFLLVDEWHSLFTSYSFRHETVVRLLEEAGRFERVTYMSATPVEAEFMLDELSELPVVEVQ